ncbi:MAG: phage tail protein [Campylobacter sp.]|nr:phage tail protein [Campylobacter sp.]MBQ7270708.1 phage tail protein [Campylobacter sp.]MBQ7676127.1 phage tail protein [Campylobacter sp.]MBQ9876715.1 phage tail protein [Campylobacter sp.]MBR0071705.1 phage tail protein [Campylobacter sp.]
MGKGGSSGSTVVGHAYSMGVAYGLCEKVDRLLGFKFENDLVAKPNLSSSGSFTAQTGKSAPSHGSGNKTSTIKFYDGTQSEADEYLTKQTGYALAYKKLAYFVVNGFIGDNVSSLPTYACVCERTKFDIDGKAGNYADINGDCNPAHALYYILTQIIGFDKNLIDIGSFESVAKALYDDKFGISFTMSSQNEAKEWVEEILRTIDGVIALNPSNGKLKLKLLRYDFNENEITKIDENSYKDLTFKRRSWDEVYSHISVKYTERGKYEFKENVVTGINNAVKQTLGYERADTYEYMSVTNATNANKVLNRLMRKLTYPYATLKFSVSNVEFKNLAVGDVLIFSNSALKIKNLKIRVLNLGADKDDDQSLEVEAVEDVFSLTNIHITSEQKSLAKELDLSMSDLEYFGACEATIEMGDEQAVLPLAVKPSGFVQSIECKDGAQGKAMPCEFWELGELISNFDITDEFSDEAYFDIKEITPLWSVAATRAGFQRLKMTCLIDSEFINFQFREELGDGKWRIKTLMRGLSGTKITTHKKGAKVWFAPIDANDLKILPIISPNTTLNFTALNYLQRGEKKSLSFNHSQNAKRAYAPSNVWGERDGNNVILHWRNCVRLHGANYRNADNILAGVDENLQEGSTFIEYNGNLIEVPNGESVRLENVANNTTFKLYSIGLNGSAYKSDTVSVRV